MAGVGGGQNSKRSQLGFGLDLTKAKNIQQEHLDKATQKKQHAFQVAQLNINAVGAQQDEQSHDAPLAERGSQQSQGQGDSAPRDLDAFKIAPDQLNDEDFDFKGTSRKEYENEFYKRICSEVIDNFLYLGSDLVAKDAQMLGKIGITHVVNCARGYSEDYLQEKGVKYKSYHLKDHVREDIACIFYDAIQFIQQAREQGGKVYVHCVQGISRSATVCCAYKIFAEQLTYEQALRQVTERRACANPNLQFVQQLIHWHKRLYDTNFDCLQLSPRVFLVSSFQTEDPDFVTCRLITENLYLQGSAGSARQGKILDPRAFFIVQTVDKFFLWIGASVPTANMKPYQKAADNYMSLMRTYERAPSDMILVKQGSEGPDFWHCFGITANQGQPSLYGRIEEWSRLLIDVSDPLG